MENFFLNPVHANILAAQMQDFVNFRGMTGDLEPTAFTGGRFHYEVDSEYIIDRGVGIIPLRGSLVSDNCAGYRRYGSMSYEAFIDKIQHAVNNPDVDKILLRIHSPGGTVTGCAEAAKRLRELSQDKEIVAHCTMADSAAYWLASSVSKIYIDATGEVGSIGVIMTHMNVSKMLSEFGVEITHIHAGKRKADGSPFMPLSKEAKERYEAELEGLRTLFVDTVAINRGLNSEDVKNTEAMTYIGAKSVEIGLADEVMFFGDLMSSLARNSPLDVNHHKPKETDMSKEQEKPDNETLENQNPQASSDQEKSEDDTNQDSPEDDMEDEENQGNSSAQENERDRISAILNCEEAKGQSALANSLAFNSNLPAKEAITHLKASASEEKNEPNPLANAMKDVKDPQLSNNGGDQSDNPLIATSQRVRGAKTAA